MQTMIDIGARIRTERERLGLSQTEVAKFVQDRGVAGATRQSQGNYEKGKQQPSALYLAALSQLGFDVIYVLMGRRTIEFVADQLVMKDGSAEFGEATLAALDRAQSRIDELKNATGWRPLQVDHIKPVGSEGAAIPNNLVVLTSPTAPVASREQVLMMIVEQMHEKQRALPKETVEAILDSVMALQRGGISVDNSTVSSQLGLIK